MKFGETKLLIRELDQERYAPAAETAAALRFLGFTAAVIRSEMGRARPPQWWDRS